jgi:hypothetical protein
MIGKIKASLTDAIYSYAQGNGMQVDVTDYELGFSVDGIFFYAYVDVKASGETEAEEDTGAWWWSRISIDITIREIVQVDEDAPLTVELKELSNDIERAIAI